MSSFDLFPAMGISSTGLQAERVRMEVAANNLANAHSTRGADGEVYQRQQVIFATVLDDSLQGADSSMHGVEVEDIVTDNRPPESTYAPYHPDADENGMVEMPDINPLVEMMDMITATRAYEANLSAMRKASEMAKKTIHLGRQA